MNLMLETKYYCLKKPHQPIQSKPHWFGSDFILEVNRTKPNHILFYLTVRMTFTLKTTCLPQLIPFIEY